MRDSGCRTARKWVSSGLNEASMACLWPFGTVTHRQDYCPSKLKGHGKGFKPARVRGSMHWVCLKIVNARLAARDRKICMALLCIFGPTPLMTCL